MMGLLAFLAAATSLLSTPAPAALQPDAAQSVGTARPGTRPTSAARRVLGLPGAKFDDPFSEWVESPDLLPPAFRQRTGSRLFRVTSWADAHGISRWALVRGETEYFLPDGINAFLAETGVAGDGPDRAAIAAVLVQSLLPGETLGDVRVAAIDVVGPDGERCTLRVTARSESGAHEWEVGYGAGERAGQVRLVRIFEGSGATRRQVSVVAPQSVQARSVDVDGDLDVDPNNPSEFILRIAYNGATTGNTMVLTFDGFITGGTPDNLYIRAQSTVAGYGPTFLPVTAVAIDGTGHGVYGWTPAGGGPTGICLLQLGTVTNPADPNHTFTPNAAWPSGNVALDKVRGIRFPGAADSCLVHYCEQFFQGHPSGIGHTETFIDYVVNGLNDSWTKQVTDWGLAQGHPGDIPIDADHVHHLYVVNPAQTYHGNNAGGSRAWANGTAREYWIRSNHFNVDGSGTPYATPLYTNEDARTRIAVFHEFFHGVQSGWLDNIVNVPTSRDWLMEGQARFIPTVQYEGEELLENAQHLYPIDANRFLSANHRIRLISQTYSGCLFWRLLYEQHHPGATAAGKLAIIHRVLQEMPGRSGMFDLIYPNAVTAAVAGDPGTFVDFYAVQDSFAHTCWRHAWAPDSGSILRPAVALDSGNRTSAVWSGHTVTVNDGIGYRHAMDFWNFRLDPAAKLRLMKLTFNADPERNSSAGSYHLTVMLYQGLSNTRRVPVLPRTLASWDSTFEVKDVDSVAVCVVRVDTALVMPDSTYTLTLSPPLAVDAAAYDHVQDVLNELGPRYRYAAIDETTLSDATFPWSRYDVIFLNCSSAAAAEAPFARDSLKAFVQRGGYLYVSDYDYEYIKQAWPDAIHFSSPAKIGIQGPVTATITDPGLAAVFGSSTATVDYDLSEWVAVDRPGAGTTVHLVGTYEYDPFAPPSMMAANGAAAAHSGPAHVTHEAGASARVAAGYPTRTGPLMLSFADGKGRVIFTTFHNAFQTAPDRQRLIKYMIFKQVAGKLLQQALDALTANYHTYLSLSDGIAPGQTKSYTFTNPYSTQIDAVLNWGGSDLRLTVRRPGGAVAGTIHGPGQPVKVHVPDAEPGDWTLEVEALDVPDSNYAFALVVGGAAAIPGMPSLPASGEARVCAGGAALVALPVRNLANYRDTFHVTASIAPGWSVSPADTTIEAWEGMVDSLRVRVTPPPGTPASTVQTLYATMASVADPSRTASGTRAMRVTAETPVPLHSPTTYACPGTSAGVGWIVLRNTACPIRFVARARSSHGWTVTPDSVVLDLTTEAWAPASFHVSVPPGTADGTVDLLKLVAKNELYPALADSLVDTLLVQYGAPEALVPPPVQSLRSLDLSLVCGVYNHAACPKLMSIAISDSVGWPLSPTSFTAPAYPGASTIPVTLHIPASAPYGQIERVRVIVRTLDGSLPPDTAVTHVTVTTPGQVLVVDLGGGTYGPYCAAELDGLGITHTDWYTYYSAPDDTVLAMFSRVVWLNGTNYGLAGADTTHLGRYLRGGGRMLLSAQDFLLDAGEAAAFAAAYFGTTQATEGGGSFAVRGRDGTFLGGLGDVSISGVGGAGDQFSPDELTATGGGFAVMDYVSGAAAASSPAIAPRALIAPPRAPWSPIERARPANTEGAMTTGIAAIANDPGGWRTVFTGFGIEAMTDSMERRAALDAVLQFFDHGVADVPPPRPSRLELAVRPNPAAAATTFIVSLPRAGRVRLALYDLSGRRMRTLHEGAAVAGELLRAWDGLDDAGAAAARGIYFARLEAEGRTLTTKLVWLGR